MADDPASPAPERPTSIATADGEHLEARWSGPDEATGVVVLTHPHPRYGGDLSNVVPASLARSLPEHGWATLRVNFRGVGASTGSYGGGEAEVVDVIAAIEAARATGASVAAVGYSFGADVLLAAEHRDLVAVVAVAPPLAVVDPDLMRPRRREVDTLVLSPAHDQFRPPADAAAIVGDWERTTHETIDGADHFMAGSTERLAERVGTFLADRLPHGA